MQVSSLAFRTDLALLRLGGSQIEEHDSYLLVRTPDNPTYWWGNCLLLDPARWTPSEAIGLFEAEFPDAQHVAIGFDGPAVDPAQLSGYADAGLVLEHSVAMTTATVNPPPRPQAIAALRPFVEESDWAQRVELTCAVNTDHEPEAHRAFATAKAASDRRLAEGTGGSWFGAFIDGRLVSELGVIPTGDGLARYQSVETHPDFRGRGLAGSLVHYAGAIALRDYDAKTLVMVADPDYLACRVYQSVGFAITEHVWAAAHHRPVAT